MTDEQRTALFDIYYESCFQKLIALDLMDRARRQAAVILWITLAGILISLLTGSATWFASAKLEPLWATTSAIALFSTIVGLTYAPSEKQFLHHDVARGFESLAQETQNFTKFSASLIDSPQAINERANELAERYRALLEGTGIAHRQHGNKRADAITERLKSDLRRKGLISG